jgi:hypothetical protein
MSSPEVNSIWDYGIHSIPGTPTTGRNEMAILINVSSLSSKRLGLGLVF